MKGNGGTAYGTACEKYQYPTRKDAKQRMKALNKTPKFKDSKLTDVYFCYTCNAWHTTSIDKSESRIMSKRKISFPKKHKHGQQQIQRSKQSD